LHVFNSPLPLSVFYLPLFPLFFVAFIALVFIAVNWCRYYHLLTQNAGHEPTGTTSLCKKAQRLFPVGSMPLLSIFLLLLIFLSFI
jgi:hypothetical protein